MRVNCCRIVVFTLIAVSTCTLFCANGLAVIGNAKRSIAHFLQQQPHHQRHELPHYQQQQQQQQQWQRGLRMSGADGELPRWHNQRNVPEFVERRLKDRSLTTAQLNRAYNPSMRELDRITRSSLSHGFVAAIFSLESSLLDLTDLYAAALSLLADELQLRQPAPAEVRDVIGNPFRDVSSALQWQLPQEVAQGVERAFYKILDRLVEEEEVQIRVQPGAAALLRQLLDDDGSGSNSKNNGNNGDGNDNGARNQIAVMTQLPRQLALKIFYLSAELAQVLEGRVPADHLIAHPFYDLPPPTTTTTAATTATASDGDNSSDDSGVDEEDVDEHSNVPLGAAQSGQKFLQQQLLQCCAAMQKATVLSILVDGNRRAIVAAKHLGLSCIALSGYSSNSQFLRPADLVVNSLEKVRVKDIYKLVKKEIEREAGPEQQTSAVGARAKVTTKLTAAPAQDQFQNPKDTFADEINADQH